jgi:hypothetical protein
VAGYLEFFGTQPPLFNKTEELLDADAWIRTIESKFACHVLKPTKLDLPRSSFAVPHVYGGTTILQCFRLTTSSPGMSLKMHLGHTIFQKD